MQEFPEKIDKYQILSVLGKGAMGIVYHAYDPIVKRDVALKFLSSIGSEETELISRFEREARLAGGLRHPNIVTIYDLGHFEGRPYIAMEYIVGRDLQAIIKQKQDLAFEQKVEIILQITKGLDAAHQKGIIHRDIKPANIRIQEDNSVKIMDFGIARMGTSELTRSGYIIGTLQYMSPEQISGDQLDQRSDIFSTGVIAYELFTNLNPFNGEHTVDIMYRILNVRPQPIQGLPDEYGTELNQIIMRALEKNRDLRYTNAKEIAQDLEEYLFYLKSLKFRRKPTTRVSYLEGATQILPPDRMPITPAKDPEIPPTVVADVQNLPTYHMPAPSPTPTFGVPEMEKAPRTGLGANYSETAQVLMREKSSTWQEKKFFILGAIVALLFIGGLFFFANLKKPAGTDGKNTTTAQGQTPNSNNPATGAQPPSSTNPTPPPPPVYAIQVSSTPPGAAIALDGKDAGITPSQIKLEDTKPHELTLKLEGYEPETKTVSSASTEPLAVSLKAVVVPGTVTYTGSYPVTIYVNGKAVSGNSVDLPPGSHTLTFRSRRSQKAVIRFTQTVNLEPGETIAVKGPPKGMGTLNVNATPSNCRISVDGEFVDVVPIRNLPVQGGSHMIQFNWEKMGKKLEKTVVLSQGQSETLMGTIKDAE